MSLSDEPIDERATAPLQRSSLREDAIKVLRAQIVAGVLEQDRLYSIGDIAHQLGTSPTPVREALLRLAYDGLITMERNRGFRIRRISEEDLDEIVECRLLLEVPMAERLATADPQPDLAGLRPLAADTVEAARTGRLEDFLSADRDFHLSLLRLSGNARVLEIVRNLRDQTRLFGLQGLAGSDELAETAHEHVRLIDAIAEGAHQEASDLMRRHLSHARGIWADRTTTDNPDQIRTPHSPVGVPHRASGDRQ